MKKAIKIKILWREAAQNKTVRREGKAARNQK
jgi:hypothetical protein